MQTIDAKAVSLAGILLIALLSGCSKGNTANTDPVSSSPVSSSPNQQNPPVALAATVTGAAGIVIDNYTLVSSTRISRTLYEYIYTADVSNWGTADAAITATLASTAPEITVMEGALNFGNVQLGATQPSTDTFTIRVDRSKPFNEDALTWTVQASALPPTTYELIDQALANGTIDAETALVYKVFSEFNDSRLPSQYQGRDDSNFEATATQQAEMSFDTLSPVTQQILAPLLQGPDLSGATFIPVSLAMGVSSLSSTLATQSTTGTIRPAAAGGIIWNLLEIVPGTVYIEWDAESPLASVNEEYANQVKTEILANIWPKLSGLFGNPAAGKTITIILDEDIARSRTRPSADCSSADILLSLTQEQNKVIAHELTHALLALNYPPACHGHEAHWLDEATAQWAQHFVYSPWNTGGEQDAAPWMLNRPELSLDTDEGAASHAHQYGAYLWFLYLTAGDSSGTVNANTLKVRQTWDAYGIRNTLQAIDSVVPGGLTQKWHEFALYNWNRVVTGRPTLALPAGTCSVNGSPYAYYGQWDCLLDKARENTGATPVSVNLNGAVAKTYPLPHEVKYLSAAYFDYDFSKDDTIRRIRLLNPYYTSTQGNVKVQAIVKIRNKGWQQAADWTGLQQKTLCRDKPEEDFERVVIVFSNSEFADKSFVMKDDGTHAKLQVSALGCSNWKGSVQGRFDDTDPVDLITATTDAQDVTFEKNSDVWTDSNDYQTFKVTGGSVKWTFSETQNIGITCTGNFGGTYSLANTTLVEAELDLGVNSPSGGSEQPDYYINAGMLPVSGGGSWTVSPTDYFLTCPALPGYNSPTILVGEVGHWFSVADEKKENLPGIYDFTVTDSNGTISNYTLEGSTIFVLIGDPNKHYQYTWSLQQNGTFASDP